MGKRKRESTANDVPATEEEPASKVQVTDTDGKASAERRQKRSERPSKKPKESKVNAVKKTDEPAATVDSTKSAAEDFIPLSTDAELAAEAQPPKTATDQKSKRSTRRSPRSIRKEARAAKAQAEAGPDATQNTPTETKQEAKETTQPSKDARFIVFVGNLPFTTTTAQIQQHFRKLNPIHIRHNTEKGSNKSKGFAFVEFDGYDKMKTALKLYHHSIFDPARTTQLEREAEEQEGLHPIKKLGKKDDGAEVKMSKTARKINVELTAGGGGKSQKRVERIETKNRKLTDERERRKLEEMKQEKAKHAGRKKESVKEAEDAEMRKKRKEEHVQAVGLSDVHPSRMKRVRNA